MKRTIQVMAPTAAVALLLAACGAAPNDSASSGAAGGSNFKPCIVSDMGGFDDKSFNQLSFEGAKAGAGELGVELKSVQSNSASEYKGNIESLVSEGCNAIVAVGFALAAVTVDSANANPKIDYILIDDAADLNTDGKKDAENVKPLLYDTSQAAFLAGYLSAGYSKTGKVGTFGGQPFPTVTIFMDGFKQGVDYYNKVKSKSIQVVGYSGGENGSFTGGFDANETAKTTAKNVIDQGVDVLLPVGGPIYQSAVAAIQDSGKDIALVGVDADLYQSDPSTKPYMLTSILKSMDLSTQQAVVAAGKGNFDPNAYVGTLANKGVGIAPLHDFESKVDPALMTEVEALKQKIINGEVTVTSYLAK